MKYAEELINEIEKEMGVSQSILCPVDIKKRYIILYSVRHSLAKASCFI